jgi:hypothetical protein
VPENPTEYQKEVQWRKDAPAFLRAFWRHWDLLIISVLGSSVFIIIQWRGIMTTIPAPVIWLVAMSGIIIASFKTWRDQKRITEAAEKKLTELNRQLNERRKTEFTESKIDEFLAEIENRTLAIHNLKPIEYQKTYKDDFESQNLDRDSQLLLDRIEAFLKKEVSVSYGSLFRDVTNNKWIPLNQEFLFNKISRENQYHTWAIERLKHHATRLKELIEKYTPQRS